MKHWLAAFRLKTLPLALGAILLGSRLHSSSFRLDIMLLALGTALCLQVLSNLANDYGDFKKGTDNHREDRQLAGGNITPKAMLIAIIFFALVSLVLGICLLNAAFSNDGVKWLKFFGLGIASIAAAIMYTVGNKAYGYYGLGDLFVFLFFGLVGVLGASYLYSTDIGVAQLLPAIAYGCLAVGVLNINNIRDLDKDILTNKITFASKLGKQGAQRYQAILIVVAILGILGHHILEKYWTIAPIIAVGLGVFHLSKLNKAESTMDYNQQLKFLSIGALVVVVTFWVQVL